MSVQIEVQSGTSKSGKKKQTTLRARIIGNFGDPGLTEDVHFDVLSRFLLVQLQGKNGGLDCLVNSDNLSGLICAVFRPKDLWIDYVSGSSMANYLRKSYEGQIDQGTAILNINKINPSYDLGDEITVEKLPPINDEKFTTLSVGSYSPRVAEGSDSVASESLKTSFIKPLSSVFAGRASLDYSTKYENYAKGLKTFKASLALGAGGSLVIRVHSSEWRKILVYKDSVKFQKLATNKDFQQKMQDYKFCWPLNQTYDIPIIAYQDLNSAKRKRTGSDSCLPLVVTFPDSFPAAGIRQLGTISYNPSYNFVCINASGFTACDQQCPTGPAGATGDVGPSGSIGPSGEVGPSGAFVSGVSGSGVGLYGGFSHVAFVSSNGEVTNYIELPSGLKGDVGNQGNQGIQGATGPIGSQGIQGNQGLAGTDGTSGIDGTSGTSGSDGSSGTS